MSVRSAVKAVTSLAKSTWIFRVLAAWKTFSPSMKIQSLSSDMMLVISLGSYLVVFHNR